MSHEATGSTSPNPNLENIAARELRHFGYKLPKIVAAIKIHQRVVTDKLKGRLKIQIGAPRCVGSQRTNHRVRQMVRIAIGARRAKCLKSIELVTRVAICVPRTFNQRAHWSISTYIGRTTPDH